MASCHYVQTSNLSFFAVFRALFYHNTDSLSFLVLYGK